MVVAENKTEVLAVFARAPEAGKVKTRLAKSCGAARATELYSAMLCDVLSGARRAAEMAKKQFEIVVFGTPRDAFSRTRNSLRTFWRGAHFSQSDGDLSARLHACFAVLRKNGFERIVVIGSDAPDLPPQFIAQAFEELKRCDLVFGPAHDGGFYLVGASCALPSAFFGDVRWSDAQTLNDVLRNASRKNWTTRLLPLWRDVDNDDDLRALKLRLRNGESEAPHILRVLDIHLVFFADEERQIVPIATSDNAHKKEKP